MRRAGRWAAYAGIGAAELSISAAYQGRGTWWHYLLHQLIGWGLGLSVAGVLSVRGRVVPPLPAALLGQLVSIVPDLMFRYLRMPHTQAMDWWVGHISVHRGPSPMLVALGVLLLGCWGWTAAAYDRPRTALALSIAGPVLLTVACLLAVPIPTRLADF